MDRPAKLVVTLRLAAWTTGLAALAGVAYLVHQDSVTALDYIRVLVWPAVAAIAIVLLRRPILQMLRGLYL